MDHERIKRRVAGRKQAESIIGLVDLPHRDCVDAFLDELRRTLCPAEVAVKADAKRATIRELSVQSLPFGAHAGAPLDEVPRDYLHWLMKASEENIQAVQQYLELTADQDEEPTE